MSQFQRHKTQIGDLKKHGSPVNYSKHERRHPYLSMDFTIEPVTGILPEEKQIEFRKLMNR